MENKILNFNLPESPVVFEPEHHTYDLNGKQLSGVTAIVKWLFPDTYAGIPESVLMQAADYGTLIHSKCELADSMGIADDPIVQDYQRIIKDAGLQVSATRKTLPAASTRFSRTIALAISRPPVRYMRSTSLYS